MLRSIRRLTTVALTGAVLASSACDLTGPALSENPNNPTPGSATPTQLFVAFQAEQFLMFSETEAFTICIWMQQCTATNGRFLEQQGVFYQFDPLTFSLQFSNVYIGGGLIDIHTIESGVGADLLFLGIAQVWEAIMIGEAADKWGDIPYSQAVNTSFPTPVLDPQVTSVYPAIQGLLSTAIVNLAGGANSGAGPGPADLVYFDPNLTGAAQTQQQAGYWIALAHSLKARYALHAVEFYATNTAPPWNAPTQYTSALTEAVLGISSDAGNFHTTHSGASLGESNAWYRFGINSGFGGDLLNGPTLIAIMTLRSDPRIPVYFVGCCAWSRSTITFPQPWVTHSETLLIAAEAALLQGGSGGNVGAAQPFYTAYRANEGLTAQALPGTTAGALNEIMTEKYILLYQNYEYWNDYKRNCIPALIPTASVSLYGNKIPARLYYGEAEQTANPNVPDPGQQLGTNGFRNPNDRFACP